MKPKPPLAVFCLALALSACAKPSTPARGLTNDEIIAQLNARAGDRVCCSRAGAFGRGKRELFVLIRRQVKGEDIACGWSGFAKVWPQPTMFIVRQRRLYLPSDFADGDFERITDRLCGDDWIKPLYATPVS